MGRALAASALSLIALHASAQFVTAEWSASRIVTTAPYDGLKGSMFLVTTPPIPVGILGVRAAQIDVGPIGGDFIGVGTANGAGTGSNPDEDCLADYTEAWSGYYDFKLGNVMICHAFALNAYSTGSNPTFQILYEYCSTVGLNRWVVTFGGVRRGCVGGPTSAARVGVGLEAKGTLEDQNFDVKYTNLKKNPYGSGVWNDYGNPSIIGEWVTDDFYSRTYVNNTSENFFLAPLG